jgi:hypothetical protein
MKMENSSKFEEICMSCEEDEVSPYFFIVLAPNLPSFTVPRTTFSFVQSFYESLKMDAANKAPSKVEGFAFGVGEVNTVCSKSRYRCLFATLVVLNVFSCAVFRMELMDSVWVLIRL